MSVLYSILTVIYTIFLIVICGFILWNVFKTKRITEKVVGLIAVLMFALRIFFIK